MGLFDFFRSKSNKENKSSNALEIRFSSEDYALGIWSIGFYGLCSKSPNGEYIIACQDSDYQEDSDGVLRENDGKTILLKNKHLVYQVDMQRPFKGAVSNNGIGAVHDIGLGDSPRKGTFYVLDINGEPIITYQIKASYPNPGVSDWGEIAWLSTGEELLFFSLSKRCLLFQVIEEQPPEKVEIVGDQLHVTLRAITRKYTSYGTLINSDEVANSELKWLLDKGNSFSLEAKATELLDNLKLDHNQPQSVKAEIDMFLETALKREDNDDTTKARIHRKLGEAAEAIGDKVGAKRQYTQAIKYNPKVGVKRALANIEKELAGRK